MSLWLAAAIACACLLIEAFFSGAEMALVSADRIAMKARAERGGYRERLVCTFFEAPERLLATTLLGTNLAVAAASVVVTLAALPRWPRAAALVTVGVLSPAMLLLGEIVPKTVFQQGADRWAPRLIVPLRAANIVLSPIVAAVSAISGILRRLLRVGEPRPLITREELILLLRGSATSAEISEQERRMITRVFAFTDLTIGDVLLPLSEVTALPDDATVADAAREVRDKQHSRIPIYRERLDQIVGVLYAFDLLSQRDAATSVAGIARPAVFVPPSMMAIDLLVRLQREGIGMAVVVDEYGGAVGVVTIEDLLEEVVGEIEDEFDRAPSPVRQEAPNVYRVRGRTEIALLNQILRLELPEGEEYETVAGLVLDRLRRIPAVGDEVKIGPVSISVVTASERAIEEVRIRVGRR